MSYDLTIKDVEKNETRQQRIEELKEMKEILEEYDGRIIEVDLVRVKVKGK